VEGLVLSSKVSHIALPGMPKDCVVCLCPFTKPVVLTGCGHSLCKECVLLMEKSIVWHKFPKCPRCRQEFKRGDWKLNYDLCDVIEDAPSDGSSEPPVATKENPRIPNPKAFPTARSDPPPGYQRSTQQRTPGTTANRGAAAATRTPACSLVHTEDTFRMATSTSGAAAAGGSFQQSSYGPRRSRRVMEAEGCLPSTTSGVVSERLRAQATQQIMKTHAQTVTSTDRFRAMLASGNQSTGIPGTPLVQENVSSAGHPNGSLNFRSAMELARTLSLADSQAAPAQGIPGGTGGGAAAATLSRTQTAGYTQHGGSSSSGLAHSLNSASGGHNPSSSNDSNSLQ
jgi:hypothetical protein